MDVIEEILTRLPVKHVLRCKLLSKSCYNLIETPNFINKHLHHHQSDGRSKGIFVGRKKNLDDSNLSLIVATLSSSCYEGESPVPEPPDYLLTRTLAGSCNGLLVFSSSSSGNISERFTVCNPATRKYMSIPKPPLMLKYNNYYYWGHYYYTTALGFAYDAKSGDYKLIKIGQYDDNYDTCFGVIQVWSMNTNSWKQISPSPMSQHIIAYYYGLLVNGILYWLARDNDYSRGHDPIVISFDPANDTCGEVALPKEFARRHCYDINVIDFMGFLALSLPKEVIDFHSFDIWVMDNGGSNIWTKRFSIGPFSTGVRTIQTCINGNFVFYEVSHRPFESTVDCEIVLYDPNRNQVVTEATVKGLQHYRTTPAWRFTESLVSVSSPNYHMLLK